MDENEKNAREINDMLTKLRESVVSSAKNRAGNRKNGSVSYDRELAELLKKHLGDDSDNGKGEGGGASGEINDRNEEFSTADLSIVKDGTVDPGRFGREIRRDDLAPAPEAGDNGENPVAKTDQDTEDVAGEPSRKTSVKNEEMSDGASLSGENGSSEIPPALREALDNAFRAEKEGNYSPEKQESRGQPGTANQSEGTGMSVDSTDCTEAEKAYELKEPKLPDEPGEDEAAWFSNEDPGEDRGADDENPASGINAADSNNVNNTSEPRQTEEKTMIDEAESPAADESAANEVLALKSDIDADNKSGSELDFDRDNIPITSGVQQHIDFSTAEMSARTSTGSEVTSQSNKKAPSYSDDEIKMMLALGYESELGEQIGKDKIRFIKRGKTDAAQNSETVTGICSDARAYSGSEYLSHEQDEEIKKSYRRCVIDSVFRLIGTAFIAVVLGVLENIGYTGIKMPDAFNPSGSPLLFTLIALALFTAAAAMLWQKLLGGLIKLVRFDPEPDSLTAAVATLNIIYDIAVMALHPASVMLYNFPSSLCLVLSAVSELLDTIREKDTFAIISSDEDRYTLAASDSIEDGAEKRRIPSYSVRKASFTEGYFRRTNEKKKNIYLLNYIIIPAAAAGVMMAFITAGITSDVAKAFSAFMASVLICMPSSLLLLISLPPALASRRLRKHGCAIVGLAGIDEYSKRKMIVFEDRTMFPSRSIHTKGIKLYDGFEIYDMLVKTGSLFSVVGGPLGEIFETGNAKYRQVNNIKLVKAERGGVEAVVDGNKHLLAGSYEFLEKYGIYPKRNPRDEQLAAEGEVTIIYIAIDKRAAARLYVDYRPDADFERAAAILTDCGNRVAIRTCDPGIDGNMVERKRGADACEISILRTAGAETDTNAGGIDSGIVALGSPCSLAEPVLVATELKKVRRRGLITILGVFIINIIFSAVLAVTGTLGFIVSGVAAAYLILWLLPVFFITFSNSYEW